MEAEARNVNILRL